MTEAIVVALITALASIFGQVIISARSSKQRRVEDAVKDERLANRLDRVEKKLDEHNGYAVKISSIEKSLVRLETLISERTK